MPEPFIGEIRIFAGAFAPAGWAFCNGQFLATGTHQALFSLLGYTYGGNGSSFALPDLRGRYPLHPGQAPGLSNRAHGEMGGAEQHALTMAEMPTHTHALTASSRNGDTSSPAGGVLARNPPGIPQYGANADTSLSPSAAAASGSGQPHDNMQPFLTIHYIIALQGIVPPRP